MKSILLNTIYSFKSWDFEKLKFTEVFRNKFVNFSIDIYEVGVKTPMMYKHRPKGSNKIIIPFQGKLKIITAKQNLICDPKNEGLRLIIIGPKEKRQFENIGNTSVKVLAIYAPPFHIREINHILKPSRAVPKIKP
ncbi:MAG: hypothetical protein UR15_C0016G0006 [Parcubacteria group bacterium GW2011_GWA2_31_28]|nr:MAG: hypothetical protein UR15_C0016G0006 [Parcubacteria group bacterium GW2011_GWA2_31_28]